MDAKTPQSTLFPSYGSIPIKDVTTKAQRALGVTVLRVLAHQAYGRNGNAHNPTPTYRWDVWHKGACLGGTARFRGVAAIIEEV